MFISLNSYNFVLNIILNFNNFLRYYIYLKKTKYIYMLGGILCTLQQVFIFPLRGGCAEAEKPSQMLQFPFQCSFVIFSLISIALFSMLGVSDSSVGKEKA